MEKQDYSISELIEDFENIWGVEITPRQIHFYRNKGIIPKPEGKGGGARYTEEHYLRLLLTNCRMVKAVRLCVIWSRELDLPWADQAREAATGRMGSGRWVARLKNGQTLILKPE